MLKAYLGYWYFFHHTATFSLGLTLYFSPSERSRVAQETTTDSELRGAKSQSAAAAVWHVFSFNNTRSRRWCRPSDLELCVKSV